MFDRQRVEVLERAIVNAIRAARKEDLPAVIRNLKRVEVDETKYPESIPLTDKRTNFSEVKPDER